MQNKAILKAFIVLVIGLAIFFIIQNTELLSVFQQENLEISDENIQVLQENHIVEIKPSGVWVNPKSLTIKQGDTVTFQNNGSGKHWIASNSHLTHDNYPNSNIDKCATEEEIFDSCGTISKGESFTFTFNEIGKWRYHDHKRASITGLIIVE
jgi:plastocyanin